QVVTFLEARFTYTRTIVNVLPRASLPLLDGSPTEPPFYRKAMLYTPVVHCGRRDLVDVHVQLGDQPTFGALWNLDPTGTDTLERAEIHERFETWLAVQDITDDRPARGFAALL